MLHKLFAATLIVLSLTRCHKAGAALQVIPTPLDVKETGGAFDASKANVLRVSDNEADRFAARLLQESLRETHGVNCDIVLISEKDPATHAISLGTIPEPKGGFVETSVTFAQPPAVNPECYSLVTSASGVAIGSKTEAGLFYGVQTLVQLLEQSHRDKTAVPGLTIFDEPTFGLRCRYFDASQYAGTIVSTRANLAHEIEQLARFKMNALVIDLYNLVPFKSFPACADVNTLSAGDWDYLVELAHRYHVTIIPSLQSFSQMYQVIWTCDEGKPYREATAGGLICPSRPENIAFLQGLYKDLITTFKYTQILGVGCSEVGMAWGEHYCPLCKARIDKGETLQDIYSKHVRACVGAVEAAAKELHRDVRPMMWGDEFYMGYGGKRWVGIENIPTHTIMGHWMYWKPYDGIAGLLERGYDVMFLSATYQHNNFLIDLSPEDPKDGKWEALLNSGIRNIADQAQQASADSKKNLKGKLIGGGCATFSQHDLRCWDTTWFAYALAAEYSWGDCKTPIDQELKPFTDRFAAIFYNANDQDAAKVIASAYRELDAVKSDLERNNYLIRDFVGIFDVQDKCYLDNTLEGALKLIDELAGKPPVAGKTIDDIRKRCANASVVATHQEQALAAVMHRVKNTTSLHNLINAAHKIDNHARRTEFLLDLAAALRQPDGLKDAARDDLLKRCQSLKRETWLLFEETFTVTHGTHLTLDGNDSSGYGKAFTSFEGFEKRLSKEK